ncbi:MAG: phosphonate C-P lyase system protein PhnK [Deltaproteobacteria bacterium]|jgi:putative phosphonate transport system ATP-binding protein|nr:phosphonate C-P lyase system protein PhnK [Deltaproteobacteria bacterium]
MTEEPLLEAKGLHFSYGSHKALEGVSLELYPGEILGVVGESGSGKSTLLNVLRGEARPSAGEVYYRDKAGERLNVFAISEGRRRKLARTELGFARQRPEEGLRMKVSGGGNIAERLFAAGERSYGVAREKAKEWLGKVEIPLSRLDDPPTQYSGGMRERLQLARNLATYPRLVLLDEPTGGLDASVQARVLDLILSLAKEFGLAGVLVTHDLRVARLLTERIMVMKGGAVVESGLTDRVLDDPRESYTQLLVSSTLGDA